MDSDAIQYSAQSVSMLVYYSAISVTLTVPMHLIKSLCHQFIRPDDISACLTGGINT